MDKAEFVSFKVQAISGKEVRSVVGPYAGRSNVVSRTVQSGFPGRVHRRPGRREETDLRTVGRGGRQTVEGMVEDELRPTRCGPLPNDACLADVFQIGYSVPSELEKNCVVERNRCLKSLNAKLNVGEHGGS